ncbi:hypothetical protein DHD32_20200 [Arenibacter sp. TNZ]|uniref:hypothetical protein n=1 Tax=Arenibacter TaxID=178469 RepID=UPI000CD48912|nr:MULTISPECIES: hypothetical protein [Arenibacter]MCM4173800.1 hypothetical protein [Arenibacter sp. TNZ]
MAAESINILILKTNIKSKKKVKIIKPIFNQHPSIIKWSVDIEDIDNVLRIEATGNIEERDIIRILKSNGFYSEDLNDNAIKMYTTATYKNQMTKVKNNKGF